MLGKCMKQRSDWFTWGLHALVGLVLGAILGAAVGYMVVVRLAPRSRLDLSDFSSANGFVGPTALLVAGITSFYRHRLSWGLAYRVIPPVEDSSWPPRAISIVVWLVGGAGVVLTFLRHFGILRSP